MKVDVPSDATSVKGAVRVNPQEDQYLLSFVTSRDEAERTADHLNSDTPLSNKHKGSSTGNLFSHLGLTAPESLDKAMWTGVCPPCVDDATRSSLQWIEICIEPLPHNQARVYLLAF